MEEKNKNKNNKLVVTDADKNAIMQAVTDKNVTDRLLGRLQIMETQGGLHFPPNYSYANALKASWLILQGVVDKDKKLALEVCTKESIANSLMDMVIQGLNPAKKQGYFIVYGKALTFARSYMGTVAVLRRLKDFKDISAQVIYDGDTFDYKIKDGFITEITHEQKFENIDIGKIKGAYSVIERNDGLPSLIEIMTLSQIQKAWSQGTNYASGNSKSHKNFTDEMAKKTVLNRGCKVMINSSDDARIL